MQKFQVSFIGLSTLFGKTSSLLLKQSPFIKCIKLYDETNIDPALDIAGLNTQCKVKAFLGKSQLHSALQDADIIVIGDDCGNAGSPSTDPFIDTAPKVLDYAKAIAAAAPDAIVVVAASPLNSLVPLVNQTLVYHGCDNPNKVLGATSVDNIRANALLASHLNMDPLKVVFPVIGGSSEHTRVPIFSQAKPNTPLSKEIQIELRRNIQLGDYEIKKWKNQCESLNKAYATMRLLNSIMAGLRGESHVIDIALTNTDKIKGITYFSLPVMFGREGVKPNIGLPNLTEAEEKMVEISLNHMTLDAEKADKFFKKMFPTASSPNKGEKNKRATDNLEERTKLTQGHTVINPAVPKVAEKLLPTNSLSKETASNNRKLDYPIVVNTSLKKSSEAVRKLPLPLLDPIIPEGVESHATLSHHQDLPNNINSEENSTIIGINKEAKTKYKIKSREELTYKSVMTFKEKEAKTLRALGRTEDIIETLSEQPDKKAENKPLNDGTINLQTAVDHSCKIRKSIGSREMHTNVPQNYHHTERNESNLIKTKAKNTKSVDFSKEPKVKQDKSVCRVNKWVKMKNNDRKENFSNRPDNKILMEFNKRMKNQYANRYPAGATRCLMNQKFWKYDNATSKNVQVNSSTLKREKFLGNRKLNEQRLVEPKSQPIPNNYIDADTNKVIPFSKQKDKSIELVYKNELEAIEATDKNKEQKITKPKLTSKLPPSGTRIEGSYPLPVVSSGYQNKWTPLPFHQENKKMPKSSVVRAVNSYDKNKKMTVKDIQSYIKSRIKENRMKCNSSIVWVDKKPKNEQMKIKKNKSQATNEITNSVSNKQDINTNESLNGNSIAVGAGLDAVATLNLDPVENDSSKTTNNIENEELSLEIKKAILSSASSSSEIAAQPVNSSFKTKELNNSEISSTERNEQLNGQENSNKINAKVLEKTEAINQLQIHENNYQFVPFPTQPPASSKTKNKKKNFGKHLEQPINLRDKEEGFNKITSTVNSLKADPPQKKDEANGKKITNLDQKSNNGKTQLKRVASSSDQGKPKAKICESDSVNNNIENNLKSRQTKTPTVELNKRSSNSKTEISSDKTGTQSMISSNSSLPTPINSKLLESEMVKTNCGSHSTTSIDLSPLKMSGSKLNRKENEPDKLKINKSFSYLDQSELKKEINKGGETFKKDCVKAKSLLQILQTSQNQKNPQSDCFNAQSSIDNEKQNNLSAKHSPSENEKVEVKIVDDKLQENLSVEKPAEDEQKQNLDNGTEINEPIDKESVSSEPSAHEPEKTLLQMLASQTTKSLGKGNISTTSMDIFKGPKFVDETELQKMKNLKYLKFQWKESLHALKTKKVTGSKTVPNKKQRNTHKQYQPSSNSTYFNFSLTESKIIKNRNFTLTPSTQKQTRTLETKKKSHHTIPTENNFLQRSAKVKPDKSIIEKYLKKNNENRRRGLATQKVTSLVVSKAEIKNLRKFKKKKKKKARSLLDALDEQKNRRKMMENNFNSLHHLKMLSSRGNNFRENNNTKKKNGIMYSNQNFTGSLAECVKSMIKPPPVLKHKNDSGDLFFPTPMIGSSDIKTNVSNYKTLFIPSMKSFKYKQLDNNLR